MILTYEIYRKNLKQWIDENRQFKVDDEYLPNFIEQESTPLSGSLLKMKSIVGKLLKGKGNNKSNHPILNRPSSIDRNSFNKQKREYWKNEFFPLNK